MYYILREKDSSEILCLIIYLYKKTAVLVTGVFEIFFGIALLIKRPASWLKKGINLFLLAVLPANVYMARKKLPLGDKEVPAWALWLRLPIQFVLIGLVKKL